MKYLIRCAVLASVLVVSLTGSRPAAAGSLSESAGLRLQPCALLQGPARREVAYPDHLHLRLGDSASSVPDVPASDDIALFGVLVLKRPSASRFVVGPEDVEAARWRWVRSTIADVVRAQRDYSFGGWFPTACLAAGALTLAWQSGTLGEIKVAAKTWRAGGVLGIQAAF